MPSHHITMDLLGMKVYIYSPFLDSVNRPMTLIPRILVNRVLARAICMHIHGRVIRVCLSATLVLLLLLRRIAVLVAPWIWVVALKAPSNRAGESIWKDRVLDSQTEGTVWSGCHWRVSQVCCCLWMFICPVLELMLQARERSIFLRKRAQKRNQENHFSNGLALQDSKYAQCTIVLWGKAHRLHKLTSLQVDAQTWYGRGRTANEMITSKPASTKLYQL